MPPPRARRVVGLLSGLLFAVLGFSGNVCAESATASPATAPHAPSREELARYPWLASRHRVRTLESVFPTPPGFSRVSLPSGSFGAWLRSLPLRPDAAPVLDYEGDTLHSSEDPRIAAVAELDVTRFQQCADSIIRLHAEWLWSAGRTRELAYRFTSGHLASWSRYAAGERPRISGRHVSWAPGAPADDSRKSFRAWLGLVFTYAGTLSLAAEPLHPKRTEVLPGDFFVLGGSPGHTVLILDVARDTNGHQVALLGQGFTPAQDFHILSHAPDASWFPLDDEPVATPFWQPFPWSSLRRFQAR